MKKNEPNTVVILFADITGSSQIYKEIGDQAGHSFIAGCIETLSEITAVHGGEVIKTIGDEVMCSFSEPQKAVEAAIGMNNAFEDIPEAEKHGIQSPNLYVGMHVGKIVKKGNDLFGKTVNIASHLVKIAKPRQILVTNDLRKILDDSHKLSIRYLYKSSVKGEDDFKVFEYVWEMQDVTMVQEEFLDSSEFVFSLELKINGELIVLDKNRPKITFGRQAHNEVVIKSSKVSRTHAYIEYRSGKFFIVDKSTNGTYLKYKDGKKTSVKMSEAPLFGEGKISLGQKIFSNTDEVVFFKNIIIG